MEGEGRGGKGEDEIAGDGEVLGRNAEGMRCGRNGEVRVRGKGNMNI